MQLEKASVRLAYMLRHSRQPLYVCEEGGWAEVAVILEALKKDFPAIDRAALDQIVAMDKKGRYSYSRDGSRIRANQGHSIPGIQVEMTRLQPPQILYHGTAERFLPAIEAQGLKPMSRQFVHLSSNRETAVQVGRRHGTPVVLEVAAAEMAAQGYIFFLSANGVWQTKEVPAEYLRKTQ